RNLRGAVLVLSHPGYAELAGKADFAHGAALVDILRSRAERPKRLVRASIEAAVHARRFAAIVFDGADGDRLFAPDLARYYRRVPPPALLGPQSPHSVTGFDSHPTTWWVRIGG